LAYNGVTNPKDPILFAVKGKVFDVTPGKNFYGPGGPYQNFAGRDASKGLACGSFSEDMLTEDLNGPLDTLEELTPDQKDALENWYGKFEEKYTVVGELISVDEKKERDAKGEKAE
jgi:membrane-associated progesterone receptor component